MIRTNCTRDNVRGIPFRFIERLKGAALVQHKLITRVKLYSGEIFFHSTGTEFINKKKCAFSSVQIPRARAARGCTFCTRFRGCPGSPASKVTNVLINIEPSRVFFSFFSPRAESRRETRLRDAKLQYRGHSVRRC